MDDMLDTYEQCPKCKSLNIVTEYLNNNLTRCSQCGYYNDLSFFKKDFE